MSEWLVVEADAVERMREMDEASIDAICTDPPYGLEFMGKEWDSLQRFDARDKATKSASMGRDNAPIGTSPTYVGGHAAQKWHHAWATEALRVLKPGGHLLAFGGTRTYHRLACAIEDAGFEVRDSLIWLYGSGFPKSLDVSKAIDKAAPRTGMFGPFAAHYGERRRASGLNHRGVCEAIGAHGAVNHGGASTNWEQGHNVPTLAQWDELAPLLSLSSEWLPLIERVEAEREKVGERESGDPVAWYAEQQRGDGIVDVTLSATPEAAQWEGWGTALKPGHEPIVVARKPLSGTVAQTVLEHGTGALNIDGCRIGTDAIQQHGRKAKDGGGWGEHWHNDLQAGKEWTGRWPPNAVFSHLPECEPPLPVTPDGPIPPVTNPPQPTGGCAPGCPIAELDEQSGEQSTRPAKAALDGTGSGSGRPASGVPFVGGIASVGYEDTGGASRFFKTTQRHQGERDAGIEGDSTSHDPGAAVDDSESGSAYEGDPGVHAENCDLGEDCTCERSGLRNSAGGGAGDSGLEGARFRYVAKASRGERNAGLDGFEEREKEQRYGDTFERGRDPISGERTERMDRQVRNSHPTVKPIDLMRWLVRLVTPPGGTVLDPFTGSGTTGIAVVLEGFDFLGIEREAEYCEIARARIAWWENHADRETEDVLIEAGFSERLQQEYRDAGQLELGASPIREAEG